MNTVESRLSWNTLRKVWTIGLIIAAICTIVALLASRITFPYAISFVTIIVVGWALYRLAHARLAGVLCWVLAASIFNVFFWSSDIITLEGITPLLGVIVFVSMIAGLVAFLITAWEDQRHRAANCAGCMLLLFTWMIFASAAAAIREHLDYQERVEKTTRTFITLHQLSAEIEKFRDRLGRLPVGEDELVELRGQPMPPFCKDYRISYQRCSKDEYYLTCTISDFWGYNWDLFGWIFMFYGPNSTQRVHAILF